ncbi:alpha/beta fold hydrolase [Tenggerimyces flavus]|uniref:Alpha/beta fold hydrolase n=1 Tax=Tenggerimyces flavus TaxID=1708749 RepID=A0ABV7YAU7_9ACTN|nr:alpha/beta hydrolase [Tenggerimyces flavus]MBM7786548.1 pimeloyl-ACP methyl ester carboxylesterase [Tenggerimyces flavus]
MRSVYKNSAGESVVRQWCTDALARASFPLTTATVDTSAGHVTLTTAGGTGPPRVVLVPGTAFNAAVALPWLQALSTCWATTVVDLPGQPGLSNAHRPLRHGRDRLAWYGGVVNEVLAAIDADQVVLVGNSLGAAVVLAADSARIAARVLISPAGFIRLSVDPRLALASAGWLLRPTPARTRRMLRLFVAPGDEPPETEVEWMTLMASHCRTTLAPPPLPTEILAGRAEQPCVVAVGEHDRFLPPHRLAPTVRRTMNTELHVLPHAGHLTTPAQLDQVLSLIADVT